MGYFPAIESNLKSIVHVKDRPSQLGLSMDAKPSVKSES